MSQARTHLFTHPVVLPVQAHTIQDRTGQGGTSCTPASVAFDAPGRVGSVEFRDTEGQGFVLADVYCTDPDPLACAMLDSARITATPEQAERLGFALVAWAQRARRPDGDGARSERGARA